MESAKQKCSYDAVDQQVTGDMQVIGIGSGSTVVYAVERLGQLQKAGKIHIKACIPSSFQAQQLILKNDLPLATLNQFPEIDLTIDGADEIDQQLNCIKGGGGCHLQEKLNIVNSKKFIIVADYSKKSWTKGVPIEVVPLAYVSVQRKLEKLHGKPVLRMATAKAGPVITDNGMFILDVDFGPINDPVSLDQKLHAISGVVETGLFCGLAHGVYYGQEDGTVKSELKNAV